MCLCMCVRVGVQFKRIHETRDMDTLFHNRISKLESTVGDIKSEVQLAVQDCLDGTSEIHTHTHTHTHTHIHTHTRTHTAGPHAHAHAHTHAHTHTHTAGPMSLCSVSLIATHAHMDMHRQTRIQAHICANL